jgi:hypothetical protein
MQQQAAAKEEEKVTEEKPTEKEADDDDSAAEGKPAKRPRLEEKAGTEAAGAGDTEMAEAGGVKVASHSHAVHDALQCIACLLPPHRCFRHGEYSDDAVPLWEQEEAAEASAPAQPRLLVRGRRFPHERWRSASISLDGLLDYDEEVPLLPLHHRSCVLCVCVCRDVLIQ